MSAKRWGGADSRKARAVCQPIAEQGGPCYRCKKPIRPGQAWHADHILERENGGTDDPSNLWPSHDDCNESAGGKSGIRHAQAANRRRRNGERPASFDRSEQPTLGVRVPSLSVPEVLPDVAAAASTLSPWPAGTDISEARVGERWMGLPLKPQGVEIASVMQAVGDDGHPLYDTVVVELARRSAKTTSILEVLLGRCLERPGYLVANTAQDGLRARMKLKELMTTLRRAGFEARGLGKLYFSNGTEHIEFVNTSEWWAVPPDPGAFRSLAYDAILVDEAGELLPEKAAVLMAGLLPTQDTRPNSQTIVAGTPGLSRSGLLWDTLEDLRAGAPGVGGVVYEAGDRETFLDLSDPDNPVPDWGLLLRVHPGISSELTTLAKVLSRLPKMGLEKWQREYLCLWPRNAAVTALDTAAWGDCGSEDEPVRPDNACVAWDVDKDGAAAAIVAAWRTVDGRAHFEVVAAGEGSEWVPREAREVQAAHRGALTYDPIGANIEVADRMIRPPFRVRTAALKQKELVGSAARIEREIAKRNVVHYGDPALTAAVESSAWRPAVNARLFLRVPGSCAVVAAAEALWTWDQRNRRGGSAGRRRRSPEEIERRLRERGVA